MTRATAAPSSPRATPWAPDPHSRYLGAVSRHAPRRLIRLLAGAGLLSPIVLLSLPTLALAHQLTERYQAPLPLVAYVAGAALAVAMSFAFVMLRDAPAAAEERPAAARVVPGWLRLVLRAVGLIAWLWILAQAMAGGSGEGDVASLFLWVYGWVGLALISALIGPAWAWIDPFTTIHDLIAVVGRRFGLSIGEPADYPERLGRWPAVVGFIVVVWLELVGRVEGGRSLGLFLVGYTFVTVAAMGYFGRDTWRRSGETFSVWFGLLGRLAPFRLDGPPQAGRVRRQPLGAGLVGADWSTADLVIVALATGSIIFDGLSQTQLYFDTFVATGMFGTAIVRDTIMALVVLGGLVAVVLLVAGRLGRRAVGAGLLPVAVGYLVAHYLAYLLVDGQRILAALNDPLLRGDNLLPFELGFWEPTLFLPTAVLWSIQLAAVVGGHMFGAWAGHAASARDTGRVGAAAQLPLALLMVALTSVTLWSLGQTVLIEETAAVDQTNVQHGAA